MFRVVSSKRMILLPAKCVCLVAMVLCEVCTQQKLPDDHTFVCSLTCHVSQIPSSVTYCQVRISPFKSWSSTQLWRSICYVSLIQLLCLFWQWICKKVLLLMVVLHKPHSSYTCLNDVLCLLCLLLVVNL